MKVLRLQMSRYLLVGVVNTTVGLSGIYLMLLLGASDLVANALGYLLGFVTGYALNGKWTFQAERLGAASLMRYWVVVASAYLANGAVLLGLRESVGIPSHLAQLAAVAVYSVLSFTGLKLLVFAGDRSIRAGQSGSVTESSR